MKHDEEGLQNNIEQGKIGFGADEAAYEAVFSALQKEPDHLLPASFADKVVAKLSEKQTRTAAVREYVWMALCVTLLLAAFVVTILGTDLKVALGLNVNLGYLKAMTNYKGLFIFGFCFMIFLHWLDKRLVRKTFKGSE